jgi:hypothetical protein
VSNRFTGALCGQSERRARRGPDFSDAVIAKVWFPNSAWGYVLIMGSGEVGVYYTRTSVGSWRIMVGFFALTPILAMGFGQAVWSGRLIFLSVIVVGMLVLRYLVDRSLDRLLAYKAFFGRS